MKDKKEFFNTLEGNAERATGQGNIKKGYMKDLEEWQEKESRQSKPVNSKEGLPVTSEQKQRIRLVGHFRDILNRPPPTQIPKITYADDICLLS